jgi:predicted Rossmann fold nucleotide-binding protein DprA/Smf involved in DNA uptake
MKKIKNQLKTIAKSLLSLSNKVEKIAERADALIPVKPAPAAKKTPAKKAAAKKKPRAAKAAPAKQLTVLDSVFGAIESAQNGITVAALKKEMDLNAKQLSNALYKLAKKGKIEAKSRGIYFKK